MSEANDTSATVERARHIASIARDAKHFAYADEFDLLAEAIDALTAERDRLRSFIGTIQNNAVLGLELDHTVATARDRLSLIAKTCERASGESCYRVIS